MPTSLQNLGFHRDSGRLQTAGLSTIGRVELSVELSEELVEAAAGRLLVSVASYVVSTNSGLEAVELLRSEGHFYRPVEDSSRIIFVVILWRVVSRAAQGSSARAARRRGRLRMV